jgi:hypothetical protein
MTKSRGLKLSYFTFSFRFPTTKLPHRPPLIENKRAQQFGGNKQALVRWVVGVYGDCGREEERETAPQHPHPTPASICLQDGSGANGYVTILARAGNDEQRERMVITNSGDDKQEDEK